MSSVTTNYFFKEWPNVNHPHCFFQSLCISSVQSDNLSLTAVNLKSSQPANIGGLG